jgi:hypothetical protein
VGGYGRGPTCGARVPSEAAIADPLSLLAAWITAFNTSAGAGVGEAGHVGKGMPPNAPAAACMAAKDKRRGAAGTVTCASEESGPPSPVVSAAATACTSAAACLEDVSE